MNLSDFAAAMEATWPPQALHRAGPWAVRQGAGGGKRVSAASPVGDWRADDIVLAEQAQKQIDPTNMTGWASGSDYLRKQAEQKAEALRSALTPEQFERYQKLQEQQMKMYEALMPKSSTNSAASR